MKLTPIANQYVFGSALIAGTMISLATIADPVQAEFSVAYCDGAGYAANVYRAGGSETPGGALTLRLYSRADGVTFLDTEASREPDPEGYSYSNLRGENQWTLFIPNNESLQCTLSRDGTVIDRGSVTTRESGSGD